MQHHVCYEHDNLQNNGIEVINRNWFLHTNNVYFLHVIISGYLSVIEKVYNMATYVHMSFLLSVPYHIAWVHSYKISAEIRSFPNKIMIVFLALLAPN